MNVGDDLRKHSSTTDTPLNDKNDSLPIEIRRTWGYSKSYVQGKGCFISHQTIVANFDPKSLELVHYALVRPKWWHDYVWSTTFSSRNADRVMVRFLLIKFNLNYSTYPDVKISEAMNPILFGIQRRQHFFLWVFFILESFASSNQEVGV